MEEFNKTNIKAIIGLGNPGQKYYKNRHNIGFRIVDELASRFGATWQSSDVMELAEVAIPLEDGTLQKVYLIKPKTFMNASGRVIPFLAKKGIKADQILVIHDELEKKFGHMMIRPGGSARGHNGLRSIIGMMGQDFWRFRFGIGRPEDKADVSNYVLSNFLPEEEKKIDVLISQAVDLVLG
jgi:peptidyl-tRNA hydrolase, PTH1 family